MPYIPKDNLAYPVLLHVGKGSGSGFFAVKADSLWLITAKHNLYDLNLREKLIRITCFQSDLTTKIEAELDCEGLQKDGLLIPSTISDVAVIKLADRNANSIQFNNHWKCQRTAVKILGVEIGESIPFDQVDISNDVVLFGYPTSLSSAARLDISRPLLRRGCVAGKTESRQIVIDCPSYFGNSGGLVIEVSERPAPRTFRPIGVAVKMIPFTEEIWSKQFNSHVGTRYENSGYTLVEPMDRVLELIN